VKKKNNNNEAVRQKASAHKIFYQQNSLSMTLILKTLMANIKNLLIVNRLMTAVHPF